MTGYVVGALWRGFVVLCLGVLLLAAPLGRAEAVEVNAPPVISAGPPREVASGATVTLAGSASDADAGDRLSYRWTGPSNVTINDADTLNPTFVAPTLPPNGSAEVLDFTLTVSDGTVDVSEAVAVTVFAKRNVPPQASADYTANGANVTLYPAAFDADGDMLTYAWSYVSGPQVTISSADEENATLVLPTLPWTPSPEQIVVELVVTDDDGATATNRLSLSALVSERPALLVNAGNDLAVFSGSSVNLEGKALGDGTSPISFRWTVTDGITFNDPTSEVPSFIAPVVTEPTVFTVTLTVTEGVETADGPVSAIGANASPAAPPGPGSGPAANPTLRTASDTLTVTVLPIVTPVLNVSGPTSVIEGDRVTLTASVVPDGDYGIWWAQMAGPSVLEYKDSRDTKRVASPVPNGPDGPGGGRPIEKVFGPTISFTAPMVPAGQEELVLVFEALVLRGFDSVSRIVSVTVKRAGTSDDPQGPTAEETEVAVNRFVQMRITNVLALQPDLSAIMGGGDGTANLTMSSMGGQIDMATAPDKPFWLRLKGSWSSIAGAKGDYVLGSAGAHVKVSDGLALGVMAQVDHLETVDGLAVAKGTGYLVGPYVVAKLPDQALTVQGRLLYGAASNDFAPIGTFVDRFDSTRLLASVGLSGQIDKGSVVWKPSLQAAYAREDTDSYTDGFGNLISPGTTAMAQVSAGMEVTFALPVPAGGMTATLGLTNIWSGSLEGAATAFEGHRGKVSVGVNRVFASGAQLSLAASYDGLGTGDYESAGLDLLFQHKF